MRDTRKDPADALESSVGYELGRAFRRLNRAVAAALRRHDLSAAQGNILLALWSYGPTTMGELQRRMAFSSSSFTGAIDRMERVGLVRRVPAPEDRRSFVVEPADWPARRRRAVVETLVAAEEAFLARLTREERSQLVALLAKLDDGAP